MIVRIEPTFEAFRARARDLVVAGVPPAEITWEDTASAQASLFGAGDDPPQAKPSPKTFSVPRAFFALGRDVACHRDPDRFDRLYRVLHRLTHGEPELLAVAADPEVIALDRMKKAVGRDVHKMHAFVRFRRVEVGHAAGDSALRLAKDGEAFVAFHRPEHRILRLAAPHFEARYPNMRWTILTPDESVSFDGAGLVFGPGATAADAPSGDELEDMFRTYYGAIANPARLNLKAMRAEMPVRAWKTMPETSLIPDLIRTGTGRVEAMRTSDVSASLSYLSEARDLDALRDAARGCQACPLFAPATQTVFGEGPANARLVFVGEQPGDMEDRAGRPFVGPAGQIFDEALEEAGIDRSRVYVTNAVKHFKFEPRGTRRIHSRPLGPEIKACRGWLDAELAALTPAVVVCLGATAATSFLGKRFSITKNRGQVFSLPNAPVWLATWHPSALLRAEDPARSAAMRVELVADLRIAKDSLANAA